jgi:hypothetical protein
LRMVTAFKTAFGAREYDFGHVIGRLFGANS